MTIGMAPCLFTTGQEIYSGPLLLPIMLKEAVGGLGQREHTSSHIGCLILKAMLMVLLVRMATSSLTFLVVRDVESILAEKTNVTKPIDAGLTLQQMVVFERLMMPLG